MELPAVMQAGVVLLFFEFSQIGLDVAVEDVILGLPLPLLMDG
jgi:hypothetical protein